jgi:hypothetical protein
MEMFAVGLMAGIGITLIGTVLWTAYLNIGFGVRLWRERRRFNVCWDAAVKVLDDLHESRRDRTAA